MIATWMVYASFVGLFASLAAQALDRAARANRLPSRFIWLAAMIATLLAPAIGYMVRRASLNAGATAGATAGRVTSLGAASRAAMPAAPSGFAAAMATLSAAAVRVDRPVALLWAALTVLLLGRLALATGRLWRDRRSWIAREIDGVSLFVTPDLGPAVVALPRSEILLPEWLLSLDEAHIATVLRHEREHRTAGDPRLLVAAAVLTALVPWNPALWWQTRRLRLAVEMDCDARVLRADPRIDRYGSLLLAIAQHPRAALYAAATLTESTSSLERRIDAMTRAPSSAPRITAAVLGALAIAAVFAACMTPSPDMIVAPADKPATRTGVELTEIPVVLAMPAPGNRPVPYPNQLRSAGIGGVVVAKFIVDTDGTVDMKTLMIVKSDHDLFSASVRQSLPGMRFIPTEMTDGRRVRRLVQMPFIFALSSPDGSISPSSNAPSEAMKKTKEILAGGGTALIEVAQASPEGRVVSGRLWNDSLKMRKTPRVFTEQEVALSRDTIPPQAKGDNLPATAKYPAQLRSANIEGQVVARFVVRANGVVDSATIEIIKSSHDLFTNSVREAIKTYRFTPATIHGQPVDWVVTMPFVFSLAK